MKLFIVIFVAILINGLVNFIVHKNGTSHYKDNNLAIFDLGHKLLPDLSEHQKLINNILNIIITLPLVWIVFSKNEKLIKEYISFFITMQTIRLLFISLTILPKNENCIEPKKYNLQNVLYGHCYDKLFSGHVATAMLTILILYKFNILTNKLFMFIYMSTVIILMLSLRGHYTIDTVIAILATITIYKTKFNLVKL